MWFPRLPANMDARHAASEGSSTTGCTIRGILSTTTTVTMDCMQWKSNGLRITFFRTDRNTSLVHLNNKTPIFHSHDSVTIIQTIPFIQPLYTIIRESLLVSLLSQKCVSFWISFKNIQYTSTIVQINYWFDKKLLENIKIFKYVRIVQTEKGIELRQIQ